MLADLVKAPVVAHPGIDEIGVDRGQLDRQPGVHRVDDILMSLHGVVLLAIQSESEQS